MQNGNRKGIAQWSKPYAGKKFYTSILFLALPIILLVTFTFIPALDMVIFSFQNRDPYGTNPTYAGFSNYVTIFTDKDYLETFKNSLYYLVGSFIQQALALLLASILCSKIRAKGLFKGILFFPYLMNGVAVSIIFQRFFLKGQKGLTPDGTLNTILTTLGLDPILWFDVDKPFLANCCLVFISIWKYIGFDIIMYIGAIQSISPDLYEAADLDGANPWQNFRYIVFPSIKPIISLQLILAVKGAISVFEIPYITTKGMMGTTTFVIKTINTAFSLKKVGLASAMGIVLLIITIIVTFIQKYFFREDDKTPKENKRSRKGAVK